MTPNNNGFIVLMLIFFAILIWLALREIMTWYWKINRIVDLLEKIEGHLRQQRAPQVEERNERKMQLGDMQGGRKGTS